MTHAARWFTFACLVLALAACGTNTGNGGATEAPPIAVTPSDNLTEAVNEAPSGAILSLAAGEYVLEATLTTAKDITLQGAGRDQVTITRASTSLTVQQAAGETAPVLVVEGGRFTASGITFEYRGSADANVVTVRDAQLDISDCRFTGGVRTDTFLGAGLLIAGNSTGRVSNSEFVDNGGDGIVVADQAQPTLENNVSKGNTIGMTVAGEAAPLLTGNSLTDNSFVGLFYIEDAAGSATGNSIERNGNNGIQLRDRAAPTLDNNTIQGNTFSGIGYAGSSSGSATNNLINSNGGSGIFLSGSASPRIETNTAEANTESGITITEQARPTLQGNTLRGNGYAGIYLTDEAGGEVIENVIENNAACGIELREQAAPTLSGNQFAGNTAGSVCDARSDVTQPAAPSLTFFVGTSNEDGEVSGFALAHWRYLDESQTFTVTIRGPDGSVYDEVVYDGRGYVGAGHFEMPLPEPGSYTAEATIDGVDFNLTIDNVDPTQVLDLPSSITLAASRTDLVEVTWDPVPEAASYQVNVMDSETLDQVAYQYLADPAASSARFEADDLNGGLDPNRTYFVEIMAGTISNIGVEMPPQQYGRAVATGPTFTPTAP